MSRVGAGPIGIWLAGILVLAATGRIYYAHDLPLSGDEAGVGLVQSAGQSGVYADMELSRAPSPLARIRSVLEYSDLHGLGDVVSSLRYHGMHPPLYYFFLHTVLRYAGNDTTLLRSISILFSLASVLLVFVLGTRLGNRWTGLLAAGVLAVSGYGVKFGVLVRPYPLAMLLALLSTALALRLERDDGGVHRTAAVAYALTILAGLYTIYHFLFVCVFQAVYLLVSRPRDRRTVLTIAGIFAAVGLAYLPWIPVLVDQLAAVRGDDFYFTGSPGLYAVLATLAGFTFWTGLLNAWSTDALAVLLIVPFGLVTWGYITSLARPRDRALAVAAMVTVAVLLAADLALGTATMEVPKLSFFLVPLSILFLSLGVQRLPGPGALRVAAALACLALLAPGTARVLMYQAPTDGPLCLWEGRESVDRLNAGGRPLVVTSTNQRRHLLPLAHAIDAPADLAFAPPCDAAAAVAPAAEGDRRPVLFLQTFREPCGAPRADVTRALVDAARGQGLNLVAEHRSGRCTLLLFD